MTIVHMSTPIMKQQCTSALAAPHTLPHITLVRSSSVLLTL